MLLRFQKCGVRALKYFNDSRRKSIINENTKVYLYYNDDSRNESESPAGGKKGINAFAV